MHVAEYQIIVISAQFDASFPKSWLSSTRQLIAYLHAHIVWPHGLDLLLLDDQWLAQLYAQGSARGRRLTCGVSPPEQSMPAPWHASERLNGCGQSRPHTRQHVELSKNLLDSLTEVESKYTALSSSASMPFLHTHALNLRTVHS